MQPFAAKLWSEIGWGKPASVALHLAVAFLLLLHLPEELPKPPEEQSVKVELVPPPPPKPQKEPAKAEPAPPSPQAFESAGAQAEQKITEPQLPPAGQGEAQSVLPTPDNSSSAASSRESARKVPAEPVPPDIKAATGPSEMEPPSTQQPLDAKSVPVPEQKTRSDERPTHQVSKPPETKARQRSNELVDARELFSPKAIFDPRIMQAIGKLPRKERIRQLCITRALGQIRQQRLSSYADMLVPYGPSGGFITNDTLNAKGGAFRNGMNWYNVDFKCQVDADTTKVISFSFAIGGAVPKNEWNARELPVN